MMAHLEECLKLRFEELSEGFLGEFPDKLHEKLSEEFMEEL